MTSRPSHLVVTNIAPVSNTVDIEDDAADGDNDDSALGITLAPAIATSSASKMGRSTTMPAASGMGTTSGARQSRGQRLYGIGIKLGA